MSLFRRWQPAWKWLVIFREKPLPVVAPGVVEPKTGPEAAAIEALRSSHTPAEVDLHVARNKLFGVQLAVIQIETGPLRIIQEQANTPSASPRFQRAVRELTELVALLRTP